jgi:hypothetical protein
MLAISTTILTLENHRVRAGRTGCLILFILNEESRIRQALGLSDIALEVNAQAKLS